VLIPNFGDATFTIFGLVFLIYLVLAGLITLVMRLLERWAARRLGRRPLRERRVLEPV